MIKEQEIMNTNQHQFVYGSNTEARTQFLKKMISKYPIQLEQSTPIGIYLEDFYLPKITDSIRNIDSTILTIINREYLNLGMAFSIVNTMIRQLDLEEVYDRMFLDKINSYFLNKKFNKINGLKELSSILKTTQLLYKDAYVDLMSKGIYSLKYEELPISVLDIDIFISWLKKTMDIPSYFCMIADVQETIPLLSQKSLNSLIARRINANISIKVVSDANDWETYEDENGRQIDYLHDYGIVEFDNNFENHKKRSRVI